MNASTLAGFPDEEVFRLLEDRALAIQIKDERIAFLEDENDKLKQELLFLNSTFTTNTITDVRARYLKAKFYTVKANSFGDFSMDSNECRKFLTNEIPEEWRLDINAQYKIIIDIMQKVEYLSSDIKCIKIGNKKKVYSLVRNK